MYSYWGKARRDEDPANWHLLVYHSLDVAAVGMAMWEEDPWLRESLVELSEIPEEHMAKFLPWLLALHDIGKFGDGFQSLRSDVAQSLGSSPRGLPNAPRHGSMGYEFLLSEIGQGKLIAQDQVHEELADPDDLLDCVKPWVAAVTGHHGTPPSEGSRKNSEHFLQSRDDALTFISCLQEQLEFTPAGAFQKAYSNEHESARRTSWLLSGFAVLCDWLGSDKNRFPYNRTIEDLGTYWNNHALPNAKQALKEIRLLAGNPGPSVKFEDLFPQFTPSKSQEVIGNITLEEGPALYLIEAPTGSGKTEAALHLCQRLIAAGRGRGLYFGLPTQATANAMETRVREIAPRLCNGIESEDVVLAHGARSIVRWLAAQAGSNEEYGQDEETASAHCYRWTADNIKRALLAPIGVGTIDQALLSVLPIKHQSVRLFGLASKILIVDEVHASDHYVHKLLCGLLRFHARLGGSAILLSATLPSRMREELLQAFGEGRTQTDDLAGYPLLMSRTHSGGQEITLPFDPRKSKALRLQYAPEEDEALAALANAAKAGQCACWIRNTVADCIEGREKLLNLVPPEKLRVFHARFPLGRRLEIERWVLSSFGPDSSTNDRQGWVLIATQVVEQSLDLDFDVMVSDLAPIDLLIQRAGRLHRHRRKKNGERIEGKDLRDPPKLIVHGPPPSDDPGEKWFEARFPRAAYVYPNVEELWRSARMVWSHDQVVLPDECREWIEAVYGKDRDPAMPAGLAQKTGEAEASGMGDGALATQNLLRPDAGYLRDATSWADEEQTPTRLGEPTVVVRLAKTTEGSCVPLIGDGEMGWFLSQARLARRLVSGESADENQAELDEIKNRMPDKGRGTVLIKLEEESSLYWLGQACRKAGSGASTHSIQVCYSEALGILFPDMTKPR